MCSTGSFHFKMYVRVESELSLRLHGKNFITLIILYWDIVIADVMRYL